MAKRSRSKNFIRKLSPPFNATRQVKSMVAESISVDANDFLWRVDILRANIPHETKSYLSKVYVDLLMSIETSLKCLIISLSRDNELPEDAYCIARQNSHNIKLLYTEVEKRAKNRLKLLTVKEEKNLFEAIKIGVSNRYDLITMQMLDEETHVERQLQIGKISSLLTFGFINDLRRIAFKLRDISKTARKKYMDDRTYIMSNSDKYETRLELFYNTLKARRKL